MLTQYKDAFINKLENLGYDVIDFTEYGFIEIRLVTKNNFAVVLSLEYQDIIFTEDKNDVLEHVIKTMNMGIINNL